MTVSNRWRFKEVMRQLNIMAAWCLLSRHFSKQKAR
nr:MAG TPA: hypothetical protein [Caudoviricetes sp.]